MAITKSDIFAAADRIVAEGGNPTLAAIRKALGGGSFTTISEAKKEWDEQQQTAAPAPIREAAPAAIADRMAEAAAEAWTIALEMANARLQSEREALEQVRQETERSRQEAADLADQVAADFEAAQATIAQQAAEAEKAAQTIVMQRSGRATQRRPLCRRRISKLPVSRPRSLASVTPEPQPKWRHAHASRKRRSSPERWRRYRPSAPVSLLISLQQRKRTAASVMPGLPPSSVHRSQRPKRSRLPMLRSARKPMRCRRAIGSTHSKPSWPGFVLDWRLSRRAT